MRTDQSYGRSCLGGDLPCSCTNSYVKTVIGLYVNGRRRFLPIKSPQSDACAAGLMMQLSGVCSTSGLSTRVTPFTAGRTLARPSKVVRPRARVTAVPRADTFNNLINQLSEVVTNSPVNNLKKGIAKVQAGDYDEAAIKSQLNAYLSDNAVSFADWSVDS